MGSRKEALRQTLYILIGEAVGTGILFAVFALLSRWSGKVLAGGLIGMLLSTLNFFFMAVSAELAADKAENQDVRGGTRMVRVSYLLRLAALFGILLLCYKSGFCDLFALLVPLLFVRPTILIVEFFGKPGEKKT